MRPFQFLPGRLKTRETEYINNIAVRRFQSLIGRLKTKGEQPIFPNIILFQFLAGRLKISFTISTGTYGKTTSIPYRQIKNVIPPFMIYGPFPK
jgi:hypothetical protein